MKSYTFAMFLVLVLCGQSRAQWQRLNLPSAAKVNTLAMSDSFIFAGTDGDGIFVSTDNGEHWNGTNDGLQSEVVHAILVNGTTIFAGTEIGASISTNNGLTWKTIDSVLSDEGVWSLAAMNVVPDNSSLFAGTWSGVYNSTNNGRSWEATGLSNTTMPVHSLVTRNHNIFAATLGGGVFHSGDDGFSWDNISLTYQDWIGTEYISPVYSLAIIDSNVIASVDSGIFFQYTADPDQPWAYADSTKRNGPVLCFAGHDAKLFAGNSIGDIFSSNPEGIQWDRMSPSLTGHAVYSLALNNSSIFAGTESGIWRLSFAVTGIHAYEKGPTGFALEQNYPNPFNSNTKIKFTIPYNGRVSLRVYDVLGKAVDDLVDKTMTPGTYEANFSPAGLPSGVFFYSLVADGFRITKKLVLLK